MNLLNALKALLKKADEDPKISPEQVDALRKIVEDTSLPFDELKDADFSDVPDNESGGGSSESPWDGMV